MITMQMVTALSHNPAVFMGTKRGALLLDQTPDKPPTLSFSEDGRTPSLSRVFPLATKFVVEWEPSGKNDVFGDDLFDVLIGDGVDQLIYATGANAMRADELTEFRDWLMGSADMLGLPILFQRRETKA